MEGTAPELHSLTSTFVFYALYHVRSHSRNMNDIWHSVVVILSKAAAYHNTDKTHKMPVLHSLLPSLVYALPERQRLQKRVVLEDGVARCVPVSELTHLLLTVTCHLHETMQCYCSLGHSVGYAANCSLFSSVWQTHREKLESERAPRFQGFCSPIKRKEEKKDVPKMVWNKTEKNLVPVLRWTLIITGRTKLSPYWSA